jgi:hypothetical protein
MMFKKLLGVRLTLFDQIFKIGHHDEGVTFANWNHGSPFKNNAFVMPVCMASYMMTDYEHVNHVF